MKRKSSSLDTSIIPIFPPLQHARDRLFAFLSDCRDAVVSVLSPHKRRRLHPSLLLRLPVSVVGHILTFLTQTEAVATASVSTDFRAILQAYFSNVQSLTFCRQMEHLNPRTNAKHGLAVCAQLRELLVSDVSIFTHDLAGWLQHLPSLHTLKLQFLPTVFARRDDHRLQFELKFNLTPGLASRAIEVQRELRGKIQSDWSDMMQDHESWRTFQTTKADLEERFRSTCPKPTAAQLATHAAVMSRVENQFLCTTTALKWPDAVAQSEYRRPSQDIHSQYFSLARSHLQNVDISQCFLHPSMLADLLAPHTASLRSVRVCGPSLLRCDNPACSTRAGKQQVYSSHGFTFDAEPDESLCDAKVLLDPHTDAAPAKPHDAYLRKCSGCRVARYCGHTCHSAHWKRHQHVCGKLNESMFNALINVPDFDPDEAVPPSSRNSSDSNISWALRSLRLVAPILSQCQQLVELDLSNQFWVTAADIRAICSSNGQPAMSSMRRLCLSNCRVNDECVIELARYFPPALQHLSLAMNNSISDVGVQALAQSTRGLVTLNMLACRHVTFDSLVPLLHQLPDLQVLNAALGWDGHMTQTSRAIALHEVASVLDACPKLNRFACVTHVVPPWPSDLINRIRHREIRVFRYTMPSFLHSLMMNLLAHLQGGGGPPPGVAHVLQGHPFGPNVTITLMQQHVPHQPAAQGTAATAATTATEAAEAAQAVQAADAPPTNQLNDSVPGLNHDPVAVEDEHDEFDFDDDGDQDPDFEPDMQGLEVIGQLLNHVGFMQHQHHHHEFQPSDDDHDPDQPDNFNDEDDEDDEDSESGDSDEQYDDGFDDTGDAYDPNDDFYGDEDDFGDVDYI